MDMNVMLSEFRGPPVLNLIAKGENIMCRNNLGCTYLRNTYLLYIFNFKCSLKTYFQYHHVQAPDAIILANVDAYLNSLSQNSASKKMSSLLHDIFVVVFHFCIVIPSSLNGLHCVCVCSGSSLPLQRSRSLCLNFHMTF